VFIWVSVVVGHLWFGWGGATIATVGGGLPSAHPTIIIYYKVLVVSNTMPNWIVEDPTSTSAESHIVKNNEAGIYFREMLNSILLFILFYFLVRLQTRISFPPKNSFIVYIIRVEFKPNEKFPTN